MRALLLTLGICTMAALAAARPQAKPAGGAAADVARGQAVFNERCALCHYDQSAAQKIGPGLKGIYARGQFANGKKVDDASMTAWIEKGGKDMPPMKGTLKPEEIRAVVGYLKTI